MKIMMNPANAPPIVLRVGREDLLEGVDIGPELVGYVVERDIDVVDDDTCITVLVEERVDFVLDRMWDNVGCNAELGKVKIFRRQLKV